MKRPLVILHPLLVFVASLLTLGLAYFLYLNWYLKVKDSFDEFWATLPAHEHLNIQLQPFWPIFISALLLAVIMAGFITIFIYYQKTHELYRKQENFINNFTHELKTPVASLRLYLETFLKHQLKDEEIKKFSEFMLKDTQRLDTNINQILQIARLENKKEKYEFVLTDLAQFLEHFLRENSYLFREAEVQLLTSSQKEFWVDLNPDLFEMVLMNVMTNALIHNQHQRPSIRLELKKEKRKVFLSISDNGIGVAKEEIHKIFKKFYQANSSKLARKRGSGLGLYLTQQIVHLHKGSIKAESMGLEQGSTFIIELPA